MQDARENLAIVLWREEDWPLQRALREHVLDARERTHPSDHPLVTRARTNLAQTLSWMKDYTAARTLHEAALAAYAKLLAPDHPLVIEARRNLATTLLYLDEHAAALEEAEAVLEARERALPTGHPDLREARATVLLTLLGRAVFEPEAGTDGGTLATRTRVVLEGLARELWGAKRALREARDADGNSKYGLRDWAAWVLTGEQG